MNEWLGIVISRPQAVWQLNSLKIIPPVSSCSSQLLLDRVSHSRLSHCLDFVFIRTDIVLLFEDKVFFFIVAAHYTLINSSPALGDLSIQGWESFSLATSVLCFIKQTDRTFTDWSNVWSSFLAYQTHSQFSTVGTPSLIRKTGITNEQERIFDTILSSDSATLLSHSSTA